MPINRNPPLDERIKTLQAEIDALIDAEVKAIKKDCPNLPEASIRKTLVRTSCLCSTALELIEKQGGPT